MSGKTVTDFQGVPSHRLATALKKQICRARSFIFYEIESQVAAFIEIKVPHKIIPVCAHHSPRSAAVDVLILLNADDERQAFGERDLGFCFSHKFGLKKQNNFWQNH